MTVDGRKKAAVLALALGPEVIGKAVRHLRPQAVAELARALRELEEAPVPPALVDEVLDQFRASLRQSARGVAAGDDALRRILDHAVGSERAAGLLQEIDRERRAQNPFAEFAALEPSELARILEGELAQVQALVLAHVPAELAAGVLALRPEPERVDLIARMARLEEVSTELSLEVGAALSGAAREAARGRKKAAAKRGPGRARMVASIINILDGEEKSQGLLDRLREKEPALAGEIEEQMLIFDDLATLNDRSLQKILSQIEGRTLALALKAADRAVAEKLLSNLSKRAREMVLEEKEMLGPQPVSAVEEAQKEIMRAVQALVRAGEIKIGRGKEAALVE